MDGNDLELYDVLNLINDVNNQNNSVNLEYLQAKNEQYTRKYHVRKKINPFEEFDDNEFKIRFRFSKEEVKHLYDLIDGPVTLNPQVRIYKCICYLNYAYHKRVQFHTLTPFLI